MNTEIFKTSEFWLAIALSFAVSFVIAFIIQFIINELICLFNESEDEEEFHTYLTAVTKVGCLVKDIQTHYIGFYGGMSDSGNAIVVFTLDKTVFYYETNYTNLIVVEEA